jgi:8-oxo-dGTP pyrophosphatase MutT (NUDIX family)
MGSGAAPLRALTRIGLRVAYPALRVLWSIARTKIHGVQCVIERDDEVLLVRHSYGDRRRWELPGGAIKRGEDALAAVLREVHEELGVDLDALRELGDVTIRVDGRAGTLTCFATEVDGLAPRIDDVELEELRWFERDALPAYRGEHVAEIVARAARESRGAR